MPYCIKKKDRRSGPNQRITMSVEFFDAQVIRPQKCNMKNIIAF